MWITWESPVFSPRIFVQSGAARDYESFLLALNEAVKGRQLSDPCEVRAPPGWARRGGSGGAPARAAIGCRCCWRLPLAARPPSCFQPTRCTLQRPPSAVPAAPQVSDTVRGLVAALDELWALVDATPPAAHTLRYGNPAYRTWFARMAEGAEEASACSWGPGVAQPAGSGGASPWGRRQAPAGLNRAASCPWPSDLSPLTPPRNPHRPKQAVAGFLPERLRPAAAELAGYWADSFGNATRIDYGTGGWLLTPLPAAPPSQGGWAARLGGAWQGEC